MQGLCDLLIDSGFFAYRNANPENPEGPDNTYHTIEVWKPNVLRIECNYDNVLIFISWLWPNYQVTVFEPTLEKSTKRYFQVPPIDYVINFIGEINNRQ